MTKKEIRDLLNDCIHVYVENGRYFSNMHDVDAANVELAKAAGLQDFIIHVNHWRKK